MVHLPDERKTIHNWFVWISVLFLSINVLYNSLMNFYQQSSERLLLMMIAR